MQEDPRSCYSSVKSQLYSGKLMKSWEILNELERGEQWPYKSKNEKLELSIIASYEKINIKPVISFSTRQGKSMWDTSSVLFYFYLGMAILAIWVVYVGWSSHCRIGSIRPFHAFCLWLAFYLCYLLFPLVFFSIYAGWGGYYSLHEAICVFLISAVLSYAWFIEPYLIQVKTTQ